MALEIRNVSCSFGEQTVLKDLSFRFPARGLCAVTGPSGCGKTTLLRILAGLENNYTGTISGRNTVSMSFQEYRLFPQLTALENITETVCGKKPGRRGRAVAMLIRLGFTQSQRSLYPHELSGGMKQRVSLARALCAEADTALLDEPFKELDPALQSVVWKMILERAEKSLVVLTAHDPEDERLQGLPLLRLG